MSELIGKLITAFSFLYFTSDYIFSNQRIKNIFLDMDNKANSTIKAFAKIDKREFLKILLERLCKLSMMSFIIALLIAVIFNNKTSSFILILVFFLIMFSVFIWSASFIIEYGMCNNITRFKKFFNFDSLYICLSPVIMYLVLEIFDYPDKMQFIG